MGLRDAGGRPLTKSRTTTLAGAPSTKTGTDPAVLYRDFPTLRGRASTVFRSWLNHPSYDRFWQKWLPFGAEFVQIDIPVLTVTGYYSARETAALYYFTEHHRHNANANHALLIGPFDEQSVAARRFVFDSRAGS